MTFYWGFAITATEEFLARHGVIPTRLVGKNKTIYLGNTFTEMNKPVIPGLLQANSETYQNESLQYLVSRLQCQLIYFDAYYNKPVDSWINVMFQGKIPYWFPQDVAEQISAPNLTVHEHVITCLKEHINSVYDMRHAYFLKYNYQMSDEQFEELSNIMYKLEL